MQEYMLNHLSYKPLNVLNSLLPNGTSSLIDYLSIRSVNKRSIKGLMKLRRTLIGTLKKNHHAFVQYLLL